jgi:hypothetical protein
LWDPDYLTDGRPPNDRGCRACGKIGHLVKDCPKKKQSDTKKRDSKQQNGNHNTHVVQSGEQLTSPTRVPQGTTPTKPTQPRIAGPAQQQGRPPAQPRPVKDAVQRQQSAGAADARPQPHHQPPGGQDAKGKKPWKKKEVVQGRWNRGGNFKKTAAADGGASERAQIKTRVYVAAGLKQAEGMALAASQAEATTEVAMASAAAKRAANRRRRKQLKATALAAAENSPAT